MDAYTIDFETYYDKEYSLSKMTTEAYVRDPRFETILCGIKHGREPAYWVPAAQVQSHLDQLNLHECAVIAHHAHFDGLILNHHYGIRPKLWVDTLSMARGVHGARGGNSLAKLAERHNLGVKGTEVVLALGKHGREFTSSEVAAYGTYCANDCELTYKLARILGKHFVSDELVLIDSVVRMFTEPVLEIRADILQEYIETLKAQQLHLLVQSNMTPEDLRSNEKFAEALRFVGVVPPVKLSKTTGKMTYAFAKTDLGMLELAEHPDVTVQAMVAARIGAKSTINETRSERLISMSTRGPACIYLNYYGAGQTGRLSGGDKLNWQNFTRGSPLREAIEAPDRHVCVVGDSANIESRTEDWLAGQEDAVEAYRLFDKGLGPDIYCVMAERIYGHKVTKKEHPELRFMGKVAKLGLGYGMGTEKFAMVAKISIMEAKRIVDIYRRTHPQVVMLWNRARDILGYIANGQVGVALDHRGVIKTVKDGLLLPNGLEIRYPELQRASGEKTSWSYFNGRERVTLHGGKVCVAATTSVLTERGWVPIARVRDTDRVHDGIEFVNHGGKVYSGVQECVVVDGVYMTPDHEVLTDEGWTPAVEKPRPYRPDLRHVDCAVSSGRGWKESVLALSMRLRCGDDEGRGRCNKGSKAWRHAELWVYDEEANRGKEPHTWAEQSPGVSCMAVNEGTLSATYAPSMEELRGPWDNGVSTMEQVREILGGHGRHIRARADVGTGEQRQRVQSGQLRMDHVQTTSAQQTKLCRGGQEATS